MSAVPKAQLDWTFGTLDEGAGEERAVLAGLAEVCTTASPCVSACARACVCVRARVCAWARISACDRGK